MFNSDKNYATSYLYIQIVDLGSLGLQMKKYPGMPSVRIRVLRLFVIGFCFTIVTGLGLAVFDARYRAMEMAHTATGDAARLIQRQMQFVFDLGGSILAVEGAEIEKRFREGYDNSPGLTERFLAFQAANPIMSRMGAFDANGKVIATSIKNLPPDFTVKKRAEFIRHAAGEQGPLFTPVERSAVTGDPVILISKRLNRPDGSFGGDIKIGFDYEILNSYLKELSSRYFGSTVQIIDLSGLIILDSRFENPPAPVPVEADVLQLMKNAGVEPVSNDQNANPERLWSIIRIADYPLFLRIGTDIGSVRQLWLTDGIQYGVGSVIAALALAVLGGIAIFYARRDERSFLNLRAANEMLEHRVGERTASLTEKSNALESALNERTILFQEIHHRIKNSLQAIASLVRLSANGNKDPAVQAVLDEIARRIRAIGQVHQTLYEQNALELVDLKSYLNSLINSEREVFGAKDRGIKIGVEAEGELQLDMAVSVGLIVSEAVGNSFKYAFEGRQDGDISIEARVKNGHCHLAVTDNGIGFPANVKDGTGMMIIKTIARQRNATFHRLEGPGAGITFDFDAAPQASSTP